MKVVMSLVFCDILPYIFLSIAGESSYFTNLSSLFWRKKSYICYIPALPSFRRPVETPPPSTVPLPRFHIQGLKIRHNGGIRKNIRQLFFRDHAIRSMINRFEDLFQFAHIRSFLFQSVKDQIFSIVVSSIQCIFQEYGRYDTDDLALRKSLGKKWS